MNMMDQMRLGKLSEKYPRLNIEIEIFGYLHTIMFNKYDKELIENAYIKLEDILKNNEKLDRKNWDEMKYLESLILTPKSEEQ